MNDNEKIKELIRLSEENPELEIKTMTAYEVVGGDDHGYWLGRIERVVKDILWHEGESVYIGDEIYEEIELNMERDPEFESVSNDDHVKIIENEIEKQKKSGEIKEAIIVYINV